MATVKFKYDNKILEVQNTYTNKEQGNLYLLNLRDRVLDANDICTVEIRDKNDNIQEILLQKNVEGSGPGSEFPTGTYFYYQLTTTEIEDLDLGRFECSLRIHNISGFSRVVMREELHIKSF